MSSLAQTGEEDLPIRRCTIVFFALLVLLLAQYGVDQVHLAGLGNLFVAMAISVVKATLVVWYFMELRVSTRLALAAFITSLLFLLIGAIFTMTDYIARAG